MNFPNPLRQRRHRSKLPCLGAGMVLAVALSSLALANQPGGVTGTGANVTLVDNGNGTVTMNNGIVSIVCTKSTAVLHQINYTYNNGGGNTTLQVLSGGKDGGMLYWEFGGFGTGAFNYAVTADPAANSGNYAEIDMVSNWNGNTSTTAGDAEVHFSMLRGSPGFYVTLTLRHRNTYPAAGMGEVRTNIYTAPYFNWMSVDATRDQQYNNGGTAVPAAGAPQECTLWTSGFAQGQYEDKYKYSALFGTERVWGWSSVSNTTAGFTGHNIGIWNVLGSVECYNGGPMKPELMDAPMVNMFNGGHYQMGSDSSWAANETWTKVYGPYFVYFNNIANNITDPVQASRALYADALAQGAAEQGAWPYSWFNNADYASAANRGAVTGRIVINDAYNPNASAGGLWVGVSQTPSTTDNVYDFQQWMKPYQFWVKTDANGNFTIPNVIAGSNYTLFAFGPGAAGTFQSQSLTGSPAISLDIPASPFSVNVTGGQTTNLGNVTWAPTRVGPTVFEIGYPNRTGDKFRHGDDWWKGDLGPSPTLPSPVWTKFLEYPFDFPSGPNYVVGQSRWSTDWNFCQPVVTDSAGNYNGSTSTITFNLASAPAGGAQASLYIGLASDYSGPLIVTVNGNNLSVPTSGYFPFYGDSDTTIRENTNGAFSDNRITFAANLLHQGTNTITINMRKGGYFANHAMYDYIRMEMTGYMPPAPSGIAAYSGNNQILLSWPVTPGATGYNILRSTISGSGYASIASNVTGPVCGSGPANATYVDPTAVNDTTYYYVVQSVNTVGASGNSTESNGAAPSAGAATTAPSAPTGLVATPGSGNVSLAWNAASGANFYTVQRSTVVNDVGTVAYSIVLSNTVTGTTYTDTSPTNGTTYNYFVSATNSAGTSANSTAVTARPLPNAPAAVPANVTLSTNPGQSIVSWNAVPGAMGYVVERATSSGGPYAYLMSVTETTFTDSAVGNNTQYFYTVNAVNAGGASGNSTTVSITTPPAPPASLSAAAGNAQVILSWPGAAGATSYTVKRATATGGPYTTIASSVSTLNYTDTGRTNGTTYFYVVVAVSASGSSVNSAEASATPTASGVTGLVWTGIISTAWDTATANWSNNGSAALYADGDPVTVADGAANTTLTIASAVTPASITFTNSATNYTISGVSLSGSASLTKSGTGTLTIAPTLIALSNCTLTANSATVTVPDTSALAPGMVVSTNTSNIVGLPDNDTIASITDSTHIVLTQSASRANTTALNFSTSNTYSGGTAINGGTIALGSVNANDAGLGTGPVTLNGGTLALYDWNGSNLPGSGTFSNSIVVNANGTILAAQRHVISSNVTGAGNLTLSIPYVRTDLTGNWALFTGRLNVITSTTGGDLRLAAATGLPLAAINMGANTTAYFTGTLSANGTSVSLGELSGVTGAVLKGGPTVGHVLTWSVGGLNTNATFAGNIMEQGSGNITAINKVGSGTWTLSGTLSYVGNTTVTAGTLQLAGTLVNNATLEVANGGTFNLVGGAVTVASVIVDSGGAFTGGANVTLAANVTNNGNISFGGGGTFHLTGNVTNNGTMRLSGGTLLSQAGAFTNNGVLDLITGAQTLPANFVNNGVVLKAGTVRVDSIAVSAGTVTIIVPSYIGHNFQLQWSLSMNPTSWQNIGAAQAGTGGNLTFTNTGGISSGMGFYRILVSP